MRITTLGLTLFTLSCALLQASPSNGQILEKKINATYKNTNLQSVLYDLQLRENTYFSFMGDLHLENIAVQTVTFNGQTLRQVLQTLFADHAIDFQEYQGAVVLTKKQQPGRILGKVTDMQGTPLGGATIRIKPIGQTATTDENGDYLLHVRPGTYVLEASYISYVTGTANQVTVAENTEVSINMMLKESLDELEEIVVIGYGTMKKRDLTGAVSSVDRAAIMQRPVTNIGQVLAGRVPGADVSINSGAPGGSPRINIRGATSVSNSNDPLYVVDGVMVNVERMQNNSHPINSIDPNNIESIEVLKDASATAIYGARGANGVVLITTRNGKNASGVAYDGYTGLGQVVRRMDLMNAEEFLRVEEIAYSNAEKFDPEGFARGSYTDPLVKRRRFIENNNEGNPVLFDNELKPLYDTDWQDEAFQNAMLQNHSLSFSGRNDRSDYGLYMTYRDEDGALKGSWLNRYAARFNLNAEMNDWLSIGGNLSYNKQKERLVVDWGLRSIYQNIPILPVKFPDGTWAKGETYPGIEGPNQQQVVEGDDRFLETQNILANVFSNIRFSPSLSLKTTVATNITRQQANRYAGRNVDWVSMSQGGIASITNQATESWQLENLLNYSKSWQGKHQLDALLGQSIQTTALTANNATSWGFLDDYYSYNNLGAGDNPRPPSSSRSEYSMASFFGRVNYGYSGRYLFTATGRMDGSSRFGNNNRYAFFPSVALGWVISEEKFMEQAPWINFLKLRSSYGFTGNSEIANYRYAALLNTYQYIFGGSRAIGVGLSSLANPDLRWENNEQADVGIELGLWENRVSLTADVYYRKSNDMLLARPVPRSSGFVTVVENIGNMENKGIELSLTTRPMQNERFSWTTMFNIAMNRNKVLKLHGGSDINVGSVPGGSPGTIIREGFPVNTFVGYVRLGTWGTDQAEEAAKFRKKPGDVRYADINGDQAITAADRIPIGNGMPKGYGSFINTFSYSQLSLAIDLQYMYGNDIMWEANQAIEDRTGAYNNMLRTVLNAWTPENQDTPIAQNKPLQVGYDTNNDTHRMKNGAFLRARNVSLSYQLTPKLVSKLHVAQARIYVSAQNLFVVSQYPGYDPEISTVSGEFARGRASYYEYPKPRVFMLGINVSL